MVWVLEEQTRAERSTDEVEDVTSVRMNGFEGICLFALVLASAIASRRDAVCTCSVSRSMPLTSSVGASSEKLGSSVGRVAELVASFLLSPVYFTVLVERTPRSWSMEITSWGDVAVHESRCGWRIWL